MKKKRIYEEREFFEKCKNKTWKLVTVTVETKQKQAKILNQKIFGIRKVLRNCE